MELTAFTEPSVTSARWLHPNWMQILQPFLHHGFGFHMFLAQFLVMMIELQESNWSERLIVERVKLGFLHVMHA